MIINDLDGYYIVFDTKNWNTELDTLAFFPIFIPIIFSNCGRINFDDSHRLIDKRKIKNLGIRDK